MNSRHTIFSVTILSLIFGFALFSPQMAYANDADIVISEVVFNATCAGTDVTTCGASNEDRFEWVEIKNKGIAAVSLNGWQICDLGGTPGCDTLPDQTIQPGEYWIIAYNTTALQTEFNQYTPAKTVDAGKTISLNSTIGGGLRNGGSGSPEGLYLVNASSQDVTCISWGDTNTLCSTRTTLGSETDTNFQTNDGQSIANMGGTWYKHGPSNSAQQASPYVANTNTSGATAVTLRTLSAAAPVTPWAVLPVAGMLVAGAALYRRRARAA